MAYTELLSQEMAIPAAGVFPASQAAGTYLTSAVDLGVFPQVEFRLDVGAISSSGTVNFQLVGSNQLSGTYTAIPGTSIAQLSQAAGNGNQSATVCVTSEKINSLGLGYRYVKGQLVTAGAAAVAGVSVRAKDQHWGPGSNFNDASVVQQIMLFR